MSDTPRTDEVAARWPGAGVNFDGMMEHARQLERELNARGDVGGYDQAALDAASREVHMMLLREGSSWGTKACEEMGRVFMTAYRKALK